MRTSLWVFSQPRANHCSNNLWTLYINNYQKEIDFFPLVTYNEVI